MEKRMTWEEMEKAFPEEWLLIIDVERDVSGHMVSGVVARHSIEKEDVFRLPAPNKSCTFKYTGECQFPGGWRAHAEHNHF